jgi:hypothetical protein
VPQGSIESVPACITSRLYLKVLCIALHLHAACNAQVLAAHGLSYVLRTQADQRRTSHPSMFH